MPEMRLDKIICDAGLASRSEARSLIRAGRVTAAGAPATRPEERFEPETSDIRLDGKPVRASRRCCLMLDKPAGVLSATEDASARTVIDLLPPEYGRMGLFPVGRLDKDTTGLLLLTNDGDLAHRIISPKKMVPKLYIASLDRPADDADGEAFAAGVRLRDGTACLPATLELSDGGMTARVTVFEGKYHQVKRMFAARGKTVVGLRRLSVGALSLDPELGSGGFRELDEREIALIFRAEPADGRADRPIG